MTMLSSLFSELLLRGGLVVWLWRKSSECMPVVVAQRFGGQLSAVASRREPWLYLS